MPRTIPIHQILLEQVRTIPNQHVAFAIERIILTFAILFTRRSVLANRTLDFSVKCFHWSILLPESTSYWPTSNLYTWNPKHHYSELHVLVQASSDTTWWYCNDFKRVFLCFMIYRNNFITADAVAGVANAFLLSIQKSMQKIWRSNWDSAGTINSNKHKFLWHGACKLLAFSE